jgi:glycosyltransferase involved in cell wall biosynthesis
MDVVVHASDQEPFGLVIVEAMALSKPVVAGDSGGPVDILEHCVNGLLSPYGDAHALARSVLRYLDDPGFARRVGLAARQRALEFSARNYAKQFVSAVRDLAS